MKNRKQFDAFWKALHRELDKPVKATNWTVTNRPRTQKAFSVWSGMGSFAHKAFSQTSSRPNLSALYCNTLNMKTIRIIHKAEARTIYKIWPKYLSGDIPRNKIRGISPNLTYIFGIFHRFENLMVGRTL